MSKKQDLSKLSLEQLQTELQNSSARYAKVRFAHTITPHTNSAEIRNLRRDVARIQTEISKRGLTK